MNSTNTQPSENNTQDILSYIQLAEITISMLATLWTSYKLGHFQIQAKEVRCCGEICCIDFHVEMESDSEKSR